jgi:flagellar assembly factor FliW
MSTPIPSQQGPGNPPLAAFDVASDKTLEFRYGLPGFETHTRFIVAEVQDFAPFRILQAVDNPEVSLLILNAHLITTPVELTIPEEELRRIAADQAPEDAVEIYVILKYDKDSHQFTANTKAPIVINWQNRLGQQVILEDRRLSVQQPLEPL